MAMKTTVEISDPLMKEARKVAANEGTTFSALVEQGLRHVLADRKRKRRFRLKLVTVKGRGLRRELRNAGWDEIRDLSYEDRRG